MAMTQEEIRQLRVQFLFKGSHPDVKKRLMKKVEKKATIEMEKEALKAVLFAQGCDISKIKGFWNLDAKSAWEAATAAIDGGKDKSKKPRIKGKAPVTAPKPAPMPEHDPKPEKPATAQRTQKKQVPTAQPGRIKRRRVYRPKDTNPETRPAPSKVPPVGFHNAASMLEKALNRGDTKTLFSHKTIYNLGVRIIQTSFDMIETGKPDERDQFRT